MNRTDLKNLLDKALYNNALGLENVELAKKFWNYLVSNSAFINTENNKSKLDINNTSYIEIDSDSSIKFVSNNNSFSLQPDGILSTKGYSIPGKNNEYILLADGTAPKLVDLIKGSTNIDVQYKSGYLEISMKDVDTQLFLLVEELPTTDIDTNKIYILPKENLTPEQIEELGPVDIKDSDKYIEFIYVNDAWECLGGSKADVDLSEYYTIGEVHARFLSLENGGIVNGKITSKSTIDAHSDGYVGGDGAINIIATRDDTLPFIKFKDFANKQTFLIGSEDGLTIKNSNTEYSYVSAKGFKVPGTNASIIVSDGTLLERNSFVYNGVISQDKLFFANTSWYVGDTQTNFAIYHTGNIARFDINSLTGKVTNKGTIEGQSFIKTGGTNQQILLADGTLKLITDFSNSSHTHNYAASNTPGGPALSLLTKTTQSGDIIDLNNIINGIGLSYTRFQDSVGNLNRFPTINNANGVLEIQTHGERSLNNNYYAHQLGFSGNKFLYHRTASTNVWSGWKKIIKEDSGDFSRDNFGQLSINRTNNYGVGGTAIIFKANGNTIGDVYIVPRSDYATGSYFSVSLNTTSANTFYRPISIWSSGVFIHPAGTTSKWSPTEPNHTLNIGDEKTGFNWNSNGDFDIMSNNKIIANIKNSGVNFNDVPTTTNPRYGSTPTPLDLNKRWQFHGTTGTKLIRIMSMKIDPQEHGVRAYRNSWLINIQSTEMQPGYAAEIRIFIRNNFSGTPSAPTTPTVDISVLNKGVNQFPQVYILSNDNITYDLFVMALDNGGSYHTMFDAKIIHDWSYGTVTLSNDRYTDLTNTINSYTYNYPINKNTVIQQDSNNVPIINKLKNKYDTRPTTPDLVPSIDRLGTLEYFHATNEMTSNKPENDGHIIHMNWDTLQGWCSQLFIAHSGSVMQYRGQTNNVWNSWKTIVDENNITSNTWVSNQFHAFKLSRNDNNGATIKYSNSNGDLGSAGFLGTGDYVISSGNRTNGDLIKIDGTTIYGKNLRLTSPNPQNGSASIIIESNSQSTATAPVDFNAQGPQIVFKNRFNDNQDIKILYSHHDNYRAPAGLKILGNEAERPEMKDIWLEAPKFIKTNSDDTHILLGGGGHVLRTDISDESLKENIKELNIDNYIEKLEDIEFVIFNFKNDENKNIRFGVIAQQVQKIFPELVNNINEKYLTVNYQDLLILQIKYLHWKFKKLEERINKINKTI